MFLLFRSLNMQKKYDKTLPSMTDSLVSHPPICVPTEGNPAK